MLEDVPTVEMCDDYETALADRPDVVLIATPPKMHIPMAMQAMDSGCHVLCEKPLSVDTQGVDELIEHSEKTGRKMMYMCSITDEPTKMLDKARRAIDLGANGLLVTYSAGLGAFRELTSHPDINVPVMLHANVFSSASRSFQVMDAPPPSPDPPPVVVSLVVPAAVPVSPSGEADSPPPAAAVSTWPVGDPSGVTPLVLPRHVERALIANVATRR